VKIDEYTPLPPRAVFHRFSRTPPNKTIVFAPSGRPLFRFFPIVKETPGTRTLTNTHSLHTQESDVWVRMLLALCGGLNLRPMLHRSMHPTRASTSDAYTVERPCRCVRTHTHQ
jgi:hypothetical protein